MKKILVAIGLAAVVSSASAQGLINFFNNATALVTLSSNSVSLGSTPAVAGQFYFELYTAPAGTANAALFTGTGVYGTNQATAGRFTGGGNRQVAGAPAGSTRAVLIRGWSASYGLDYSAALAAWNQGTAGYLGATAIAPNFIFGGFDGSGTIPTPAAFAGANGIANVPMVLTFATAVPEPTSMALAGLGAASLLIFRRRK